MASLTSCPQEIQELILSYVLTVPLQPLGEIQGLAIDDGIARTSEPDLFGVNHHFRQLAKEVSLTHNRVVVIGDPKDNLKWIDGQPEVLLHKIRKLDLVITSAQFCETDLLNGWAQLIRALSRKLALDNVTISIDGCLYYESLTEDEQSFDYLKPVYELILAPLESFAGSKDFFIHWPLWKSLEAQAEQRVKGKAYDSVARGKIPHKLRDPRMIHGWECGQDADGEEGKIHEAYRKMRMYDCE